MSPPEILPLQSSRLILRRFGRQDAEAFRAYRADPAVARYQSWETCTAEEALDFVSRQQSKSWAAPGQWFQIAVALQDTNELIGDCALKIHAADPRQATIGVTFARSHQKRGCATEALTCLLEAAFLRMELHRVIADTDVENTPAWTLMERLGFRREGHLRQSLWFKGRWADEFLYAIRRDEWLARRSASPT